MSKFFSANWFPDSTKEFTNVGLSSTSTALATEGNLVKVHNGDPITAQWMYFSLGGSGVTASNADFPVPPGKSVVVNRDPNTDTHIAVIAATGAIAKVYATTGDAR